MAIDPITAVLEIGGKVIDKIFPNKEAADKAKLEMLKLQQQGELSGETNRFAAIVEEAKSQDKWTSRARPSFMYVMYIMILMAIPMGVLSAISPATAKAVAAGMEAWLKAVPDSLWALFGAGYVGYAASRTVDKIKGK